MLTQHTAAPAEMNNPGHANQPSLSLSRVPSADGDELRQYYDQPAPPGILTLKGAKTKIENIELFDETRSHTYSEINIPKDRVLDVDKPQRRPIQIPGKTPINPIIYYAAATGCLIYTAYHGATDQMLTLNLTDVREITDMEEEQLRTLKNTYEYSIAFQMLANCTSAFMVPFLAEYVGEYGLLGISAVGYLMINSMIVLLLYLEFQIWPMIVGNIAKGMMTPFFWTAMAMFKAEIGDASNQGTTDAVFGAIFHLYPILQNIFWIGMMQYGYSIFFKFWFWLGLQIFALLNLGVLIYISGYRLNIGTGKVQEQTPTTGIIFGKFIECFTDDVRSRFLLMDFLHGIVGGWFFGDILQYYGTALGWTYAPTIKLIFGVVVLCAGLYVGFQFDHAINKTEFVAQGFVLQIGAICLLLVAGILGDEHWKYQKVKTANWTVLILVYVATAITAIGLAFSSIPLGSLKSILWKEDSNYIFAASCACGSFGAFISLMLGSMNEKIQAYLPALFLAGPGSSYLSLLNLWLALAMLFYAFYLVIDMADIFIHPTTPKKNCENNVQQIA